MVAQIIGAVLAVYMFAMLLDVPWRYAPYTAVIGGIAWFVYIMLQNAGSTSMTAAFVSTLVVALFSHIFARIKKAPVTVFLVSGILPVVPGAAIYRCVYFLIKNDSALSTGYLVETLQIAGAIAMAVFIMDSIFRLVQAYQERRLSPRP